MMALRNFLTIIMTKKKILVMNQYKKNLEI